MSKRFNLKVLGAFALIALATATQAMIFGRDERNDPAAFPDAGFLAKYDNLGRIECPIPTMPGRLWTSSGFLYGSGDTLITVSHAFYIGQGKYTRLNPASCVFSTYDNSGNLRDKVAIRYASLGWDDVAKYGDRSFDLGVVKLTRALSHAVHWPPLGNASSFSSADIAIFAYHNDVPSPKIARVTRGRAIPMPKYVTDSFNILKSSKLSKTASMFIYDADTNHGASGGLVIDLQSGMIFGVVGGAFSIDDGDHGEFSPEKQIFNYGVKLTPAIVELVKHMSNE